MFHDEDLVCRIIQEKGQEDLELVFSDEGSIHLVPKGLTVDLDGFLKCVERGRERLAGRTIGRSVGP